MSRNAEEQVTDADLVRYIDGELSPARRFAVEALIAERADVAARVARLRQRTARLAALLGHVTPDDAHVQSSAHTMRPHVLRYATRPAWRLRLPAGVKVAAGIALLFGLVLAVPEARAWVFAQARAVAARIGISAADAPSAADSEASDARAPTGVIVTFAVPGDTLNVRVLGTGMLVVRRGAVEDATAEADDASARFTVLPSELRIDGDGDIGTVVLQIPAHVIAVRVRNGDRATAVYTVPPDGAELRIGLRRE